MRRTQYNTNSRPINNMNNMNNTNNTNNRNNRNNTNNRNNMNNMNNRNNTNNTNNINTSQIITENWKKYVPKEILNILYPICRNKDDEVKHPQYIKKLEKQKKQEEILQKIQEDLKEKQQKKQYEKYIAKNTPGTKEWYLKECPKKIWPGHPLSDELDLVYGVVQVTTSLYVKGFINDKSIGFVKPYKQSCGKKSSGGNKIIYGDGVKVKVNRVKSKNIVRKPCTGLGDDLKDFIKYFIGEEHLFLPAAFISSSVNKNKNEYKIYHIIQPDDFSFYEKIGVLSDEIKKVHNTDFYEKMSDIKHFSSSTNENIFDDNDDNDDFDSNINNINYINSYDTNKLKFSFENNDVQFNDDDDETNITVNQINIEEDIIVNFDDLNNITKKILLLKTKNREFKNKKEANKSNKNRNRISNMKNNSEIEDNILLPACDIITGEIIGYYNNEGDIIYIDDSYIIDKPAHDFSTYTDTILDDEEDIFCKKDKKKEKKSKDITVSKMRLQKSFSNINDNFDDL